MTTEITTTFSVEGLSREQAIELVREIELAVMLKTGQRVGIHSTVKKIAKDVNFIAESNSAAHKFYKNNILPIVHKNL